MTGVNGGAVEKLREGEVTMFPFDADDIYEANAEAGWFAARLQRDGHEVRWSDLSHHRIVEIAQVIVDSNDEFRFQTAEGTVYSFRRLTLEGYRGRIRTRAGGSDYETLDELKEAARRAIQLAG